MARSRAVVERAELVRILGYLQLGSGPGPMANR